MNGLYIGGIIFILVFVIGLALTIVGAVQKKKNDALPVAQHSKTPTVILVIGIILLIVGLIGSIICFYMGYSKSHESSHKDQGDNKSVAPTFPGVPANAAAPQAKPIIKLK